MSYLQSNGMFNMYKKEYPSFKKALYNYSIKYKEMWDELDMLYKDDTL